MLPIQVINIVDGFVEAFDSSRPAPIEFRKAHQRAAEAMIRGGSDTLAAKVYLFNASLSSFLEERTQLIWDRLKEAVAAVDLEPYSDLNSDLKAEIAKRVNPTLQAAKAQQKELLLSVGAPTGAPLPNDLNLNNIPAKIYADVNLFCTAYAVQRKQSAAGQSFQIETVHGMVGNFTNSHVTLYNYSSVNQLLVDHRIPKHDRRELEDIMDELKDASPEKKAPLLKRGEDWIIKHKELLGAGAEAVGKAIGTAIKH
jgi:hypothetical protein